MNPRVWACSSNDGRLSGGICRGLRRAVTGRRMPQAGPHPGQCWQGHRHLRHPSHHRMGPKQKARNRHCKGHHPGSLVPSLTQAALKTKNVSRRPCDISREHDDFSPFICNSLNRLFPAPFQVFEGRRRQTRHQAFSSASISLLSSAALAEKSTDGSRRRCTKNIAATAVNTNAMSMSHDTAIRR